MTEWIVSRINRNLYFPDTVRELAVFGDGDEAVDYAERYYSDVLEMTDDAPGGDSVVLSRRDGNRTEEVERWEDRYAIKGLQHRKSRASHVPTPSERSIARDYVALMHREMEEQLDMADSPLYDYYGRLDDADMARQMTFEEDMVLASFDTGDVGDLLETLENTVGYEERDPATMELIDRLYDRMADSRLSPSRRSRFGRSDAKTASRSRRSGRAVVGKPSKLLGRRRV